MAVIKAVSSKAGIGHAIDYVTKKEKTEEKLVSGLHCEPETVKEEMQATKELWGKTDGRTYKHYVQSYHEDEEITPEQAHKNAVELAEHTKAWKGHEVLIATHIDKGHIHTHFIVNSVNYENGHKLQWSKHDLKDLKERCNEQSWEQGLHVPEKGKTFAGEVREETVAWSKDTYQLLKQAEQGKVKSYVQDIALAVLDCKETATSRETFIRLMNERGYGVDWQDSHKYITYTDLAREQGLHVPEKGKTFAGEAREETVAWSKDTYQLLKQAEQGKVKSYVQDIALAVLDCKETAISRQTFIRLMNERGYGVDWQDSHKYITYTDLAREQAGEKACKIRDNKLEKYYNMDFGKESMEHEFERNARTAEAEQSKRATSRVKPTEPDRAGKQFAQRSVGDVERELRGIDEAVKSRTSKGRAEQAERRRAEQEAHQRAEAERRATEEQQRIASRRYIGRDWELER